MSTIDERNQSPELVDAAAKDDVLATVRAGYGAIAAQRGASDPAARTTSERVGYHAEDLARVPSEANLGLGCGNPTAFAMLRAGDTVLDLGSGGGLDAFLAASVVGESGRVIGVDTTPEMLAIARASAVRSKVAHRVEFREGVIEELPVTSGSVFAITSGGFTASGASAFKACSSCSSVGAAAGAPRRFTRVRMVYTATGSPSWLVTSTSQCTTPCGI